MNATRKNSSNHKRLSYIDLFAGCGGLSVGLEKAGLSLTLAVEISDMASETFYHNLIERLRDSQDWKDFLKLNLAEQARGKLIVKPVEKVLQNKGIMEQLKKQDVDLVVGGPPCQGFSMAGKRNPRDHRNKLAWHFLDFIGYLAPKGVLIENVVGINQDFVKYNRNAPLEDLRRALEMEGPGYIVQPVLLNAMHFGVPQHRPRIMLLGLRRDIAEKLDLNYTREIWKSAYDLGENDHHGKRPDLAPRVSFKGNEFRTVRDALWDIEDQGYIGANGADQYEEPEGVYAKLMREDYSWLSLEMKKNTKSWYLRNHNLRRHQDKIIHRFRLYQYLQLNDVPARIINVPYADTISVADKDNYIADTIKDAQLPARSPDGVILAETAIELIELIKSLGTKKHSQRALIYDAPSPTILSLPDDFVHPLRPRTLSVREMARLQSFPDSFEFRSKETTGSHRRRFEVPQYTQVGNAVPPLLAMAVGQVFVRLLRKYDRIKKGRPKQLRFVET